MKDRGLLHPTLLRVLAETGHGDLVGVADAGLPIPPTVERIDLALTRGVVSFEDVVRALTPELRIEAMVIAAETFEHSPQVAGLLQSLVPDAEVVRVSHEELKRRSTGARAIVRTGEFTAYANVLFVSGVDFG